MAACRGTTSATRARPCGSAISVKQFPSFVNPIPAVLAWRATYSWPLRMTWAGNGGGPGHLIGTCPPAGGLVLEGEGEKVFPLFFPVASPPPPRPPPLPPSPRALRGRPHHTPPPPPPP